VIGYRPENTYTFDTSSNFLGGDASDFVMNGPNGNVLLLFDSANSIFRFNNPTDFGSNRVSTSYYPQVTDDHALATVEYVNNNKFNLADCGDPNLIDAIFSEVVSANANQTISGNKLFTGYTRFDDRFRSVGIDMSGTIDMRGYRIINLADPIDVSDSANKEYVDQRFNSIFSGDVSFTGTKEFFGIVDVKKLQLDITAPLSISNQRII
jgi:hypothetical protein